MAETAAKPKVMLKIEVLLLEDGDIALGLPKPPANAFDKAVFVGMLQQAAVAAVTDLTIAPSPIVMARAPLPPVNGE